MVQNQDSIIKFVGIATFAALAYIFVAPKLFKNPPVTIPGLVDMPKAEDSGSNAGDFEDEAAMSGATFTSDVIPGVYDYGVRLATTGV